MEFFITFFRDILDGPLYIVVSILCGILFCSCIGYLAETHFNKKKQETNYQNTHTNVDYSTNMTSIAQNGNIVPNMQQANTISSNIPINNQSVNYGNKNSK